MPWRHRRTAALRCTTALLHCAAPPSPYCTALHHRPTALLRCAAPPPYCTALHHHPAACCAALITTLLHDTAALRCTGVGAEDFHGFRRNYETSITRPRFRVEVGVLRVEQGGWKTVAVWRAPVVWGGGPSMRNEVGTWRAVVGWNEVGTQLPTCSFTTCCLLLNTGHSPFCSCTG